MQILSIMFCIVGYLTVGHLLLCWSNQDNRGIGNSFLMGSGAISLLTLLLALLFRENLRLISLALLTTGALCFLLYVLIGGGQKAKNLRSLSINSLPVVLLVFLLLPIMIGSYNVRVWGDEVPNWAVYVKEMISYNDLMRALDNKGYSYFHDYPRLASIVNINALSMFYRMHEGVGRIVSILFILSVSLFFLEELQKRWNISVTEGTVWTAFLMALICGSVFPWTASWYSNPAYSAFLTVAVYYIILGLSAKDFIDFGKVGIASFFLTVCVGMRPDGIHYLPFFLIVALYLLTTLKSETWERKALALLVIMLPSIALFSAWEVLWQGSGTQHRRVETISKLIGFGELPRLALLILKDMISKWNSMLNQLLPQYIGLLICGAILLVSSRSFDRKRLRVLLLLLLFPIYNALLVFSTSLAVFVDRGSPQAATNRHLLDSAPIVYFVLGVLVLRWYQAKNLPMLVSRMIGVAVLFLALLNSITLGGLYSHLSHDINDYMEHLSRVVKSSYPEFSSVQFIARERPYSGIVRPMWKYYAAPEIHSGPPYSIGKGELVVVYETDNEFNRLSGLELQQDRAYLLGLNEKKDGLSVLWSEKRPPIDLQHRTINAGKALWEDIRNGKWTNILWPGSD